MAPPSDPPIDSFSHLELHIDSYQQEWMEELQSTTPNVELVMGDVVSDLKWQSNNCETEFERTHPPKPGERFVWSYWASDTLPDVLKLLQETWRLNIPNAEFHHLTRKTVPYYLSSCDLPNTFHNMDRETLRSDLLRAALLAKYGGVYLDSSTVVYPNKLDNQWKSLESGARTTTVCAWLDNPSMPSRYIECYYMMTVPSYQRFEDFHQNQRRVMMDRTTTDGIIDAFPDFYSIPPERFQPYFSDYYNMNYLSLANYMWATMAFHDLTLDREMKTFWNMLPWERDCLRMQLVLGAKAATLVDDLSNQTLAHYEEMYRELPTIEKITQSREFLAKFNARYPNADRKKILNDPTTLAFLLRKAGLS